jgi:hypothetical protein
MYTKAKRFLLPRYGRKTLKETEKYTHTHTQHTHTHTHREREGKRER